MATQAPVEELNALPNFLMFVDNQIYTQGLSLLKLSLYPSEGVVWSKLDACTEPSQIFHLLQETSSKELALQKFLFALEAIGGTVRGKHCVEEAKKRLNESQYPSPLDFKNQTKKFCFFHSLVKIARKLPDKAGRKMKKHFSNHPVIQSNHRRFDTIPELFIVLYQTKIISEDDSEALQHELNKCKKKYYGKGAEEQTRLNKCLSYLTNFHKHGCPKEPFTTADEKSTASSLESSIAGSEYDGGRSTGGGRKKRVEKLQRQGQTKDRHSNESDDDIDVTSFSDHTVTPTLSAFFWNSERINSGILPSPPYSRSTLSGSTPPRSLLKSKSKEANLTEREENKQPPLSETPRVKIQQPSQHPNRTPSVPTHGEPLIQSHNGGGEESDILIPGAQPQEGDIPRPGAQPQEVIPIFRHTQWKLKVLKYGLGILILCAIVATLAVIPCYLLVWSPLRDLQQPHIVQQLDGSTVILADMNSYFVKKVTVEEIEMEDDFSIPIDLYITQQECKNLPTSMTSHEYNGTQLKNVNSTYMLTGSKIDLHILASTKGLQSKSIGFYIVPIVDSSDFDRHSTKVHRYPINVGTNGTTEETNITHEIHSSNYYSLIFSLPKLSVNLSYEMTVEIRSIDLTALDTTAFGSLKRNGDSVQAKLARWQSHYCLIAFIYRSTNVYQYIHTKVIFTLDYAKTLGLTVPLVAVWTFGIPVVIVIGFCCVVYRRNLCNSEYREL